MLELGTEEGTRHIIGWKPRGLYNFKLIALHSAFLANVKYFGNKSIIQVKFQMLTLFMI